MLKWKDPPVDPNAIVAEEDEEDGENVELADDGGLSNFATITFCSMIAALAL